MLEDLPSKSSQHPLAHPIIDEENERIEDSDDLEEQYNNNRNTCELDGDGKISSSLTKVPIINFNDSVSNDATILFSLNETAR